jgi:putative exosortase-associated protein (TIGR04073 family)
MSNTPADSGRETKTVCIKETTRRPLLLLLLMGTAFLLPAGWAEESAEAPAPRKPPEIRVDKMGTKCCRGVTNIATGWGELPRQFVRSAETDNPWLVFPLGLTRGLFMTVVRTVSGVIETAFFYVPFDGHYSPLLEPEYVWNAEDLEAEEKTE